eukprot:7203-Heterococcus_DN1.PRE.5
MLCSTFCLCAVAAAATAAASRGGALSVTESGKATIVQSTFTDAHATTAGGSAGGAIYTEGAVACTDTVFTNTSARSYGGAVFAATQSSVTLKNVNISDTTVEFDGGALVVETNAVLKLISTTITNATGTLQRSRTVSEVPHQANTLQLLCNSDTSTGSITTTVVDTSTAAYIAVS